MESTAMGLLSGINAVRYGQGMDPIAPPPATAMGALVHFITQSPSVPFQPMNINFGLLPLPPGKCKGREKRRLSAIHALKEMERWKEEVKM